MLFRWPSIITEILINEREAGKRGVREMEMCQCVSLEKWSITGFVDRKKKRHHNPGDIDCL